MRNNYELFVNSYSFINVIKSIKNFTVKKIETSNKKKGLAKIIELKKNKTILKLEENSFKTIKSIILHGSYSTGDEINFSDLDVVVIINDEKNYSKRTIKSDLRKLKKLTINLYKIDPLMHHGLMFFNLSETKAYDQSFLPLEIFRTSICLYGPRSIKFNVIENFEISNYKDRLSYILENLQGGYHFSNRIHQQDYTLKYFISGILLIPVIFLASKKRYVNKKDSFEICYTEYPEINWEVVKKTEQIRKEWLNTDIHSIHVLLLNVFSTKGQRFSRFFYKKNYIKFGGMIDVLNNDLLQLEKTLNLYYADN